MEKFNKLSRAEMKKVTGGCTPVLMLEGVCGAGSGGNNLFCYDDTECIGGFLGGATCDVSQDLSTCWCQYPTTVYTTCDNGNQPIC